MMVKMPAARARRQIGSTGKRRAVGLEMWLMKMTRVRAFTPPQKDSTNASGVVIHTNLGRAPLSAAALAAVHQTAQGYSNLEYDLAAGERGSRHALVTDLLRRLTGAEDTVDVLGTEGSCRIARIHEHRARVAAAYSPPVGPHDEIPDAVAVEVLGRRHMVGNALLERGAVDTAHRSLHKTRLLAVLAGPPPRPVLAEAGVASCH